MTKRLYIENIEEFELVNRIPRTAITDEILQGVSQLYEKDMEAFLREIIADKTDTPHTATEIADVLTTITHKGEKLSAAFVNKGRATQRVTERNVSHQISKARRMPGVQLLVLAAVGDIQDDIKAALIQTAQDADLYYMIIDATDIARLFIAHHKICPKDSFMYVDGKCQECGKSAAEPIVLTLRVYEEPRYNLLTQSDDSHGIAKRYSAAIWTDPHYSKSIMREIAKKLTWDLRNSNYYRTKIVEDRFGEQNANIVRLFIYLDQADHHTRNWYCRTLWIDPDLPENMRPPSLGSGEWLDDIEFDWSKNYHSMRDVLTTSIDMKEGWVRKIEFLLPRLEQLMNFVQTSLNQLEAGQITQSDLESKFSELETTAGDIFREATKDYLPPIECKDCDQKFLNMALQCHNAFLPFATWDTHSSRTWQQKLWLIRYSVKNYKAEKQDFNYEWKKVRR